MQTMDVLAHATPPFSDASIQDATITGVTSKTCELYAAKSGAESLFLKIRPAGLVSGWFAQLAASAPAVTLGVVWKRADRAS